MKSGESGIGGSQYTASGRTSARPKRSCPPPAMESSSRSCSRFRFSSADGPARIIPSTLAGIGSTERFAVGSLARALISARSTHHFARRPSFVTTSAGRACPSRRMVVSFMYKASEYPYGKSRAPPSPKPTRSARSSLCRLDPGGLVSPESGFLSDIGVEGRTGIAGRCPYAQSTPT